MANTGIMRASSRSVRVIKGVKRMYDIFAPKSADMAFVGYLLVNNRYLTGGAKNPKFKIGKLQFMFAIESTKSIEKKQPISNLIYLTTEMNITTKFMDNKFKVGNYIEYDGGLYVIKAVNTSPGPNRAVYGWYSINTLANTAMTLETAQE